VYTNATNNTDAHAVGYTYGHPDCYSDTGYSHANSNGYCYSQGHTAASPNASSTAESIAVGRRSPVCFGTRLAALGCYSAPKDNAFAVAQ
jgi:hypothetical protein